MSDNKTDVTLTVNGKDYAIRVEPRRTLADALRDHCGLTGTNSGCEHGVCGSCTVIVDGDPVRSWFERCLDLHDGVGRREPAATPS